MSLLTLIKELWRFFKEHFWKIMAGTLLVAAVFGVLGWHKIRTRDVITRPNGQEMTVTPAEQKKALDSLTHVYSQTPAEFQMVVIQEDGEVFDNSFVFDEYLTSPEVVQKVEQKTGIKFAGTLEDEDVLGLRKTADFRGGLAGIRDKSSSVITIRVLLGQSDKENLAIAKAYRDFLQSGESPLTKNLSITFLNEPVNEELLGEDDLAMTATPESLSAFRTGKRPLGFYIIIGLIAGFVLSCLFVFLFHFRHQEIAYAFDYSWDYRDFHYLLDSGSENFMEAFNQLISVPKSDRTLLVSQQDLPAGAEGGSLVHSIEEADQAPETIVILIQSKETSKSWYNIEYESAKFCQVPIKIIQVY